MGKELTYKQPESNATEKEKAFAKEVADLLIDLVDLDEEDMIEIKKEKNKWYNMHDEMHQIIVSKKELYWQLNNFYIQDHLFELFISDINSEKYTRLLNLLTPIN